MTEISRTFAVQPTPDVVLNYLKDFSNAEQWDPGTETCEQIGDGPIQVGTKWHNRSKIAGVSTELVYELVELDDRHVVFKGHNDKSDTSDTITVLPKDGGSEITYVADIQMKGASKLATPVIKLVFEKIGSDTEEDIVKVLNAL